MKKLILLFTLMVSFCGVAMANGDVTLKVTRINHKSMLKENVADKGTFTYKRGGTMSMIFSPTDQLLMEGSTYTIVRGKHRSVAKGEMAALFGVLQRVVDHLLSGGDGNISKAESNGASIVRTGNVITIAPEVTAKKSRLLFTSFELTVDAKKHHLLSIKMNGKGQNYTLYTFSN